MIIRADARALQLVDGCVDCCVTSPPYFGLRDYGNPEPCIMAGCPAGGLVLDPFLGSGTVGAVAERFGRRWVGTDLSYHGLALERTAQRGLMFTEQAV